MNFKFICLLLAVCSMLSKEAYLRVEGNPNTTVHTEAYQVNDDGTKERVESVGREEDWLLELEFKIQDLLNEQDYIESSLVSIYKGKDDPSRYVYFVSLYGSELDTKYDEIYSIVTQYLETDKFDLKNSMIVDIYGESIKP